ncbi:tetratricopeptide repeat protein 1 [Capsicum chacoense]
MVLIEQVQSEVPKVNSSKSPAKSSPVTATESGYVSDGYETASDTELNQSENGSNRESENAVNTVSSSQAEPNQEVLNVRALAQANDAKVEGNTLFKEGLYEEALSKYELALQVAADIPSSTEIRSICHANRAACFSKLGKHEETVKECTKALELNPTYIKALVRRAEAHEKLEHFDEAVTGKYRVLKLYHFIRYNVVTTDMTKILELEPSHDQARRSVIRLKPLADEKREKMKEEMIGKLKEMGNSILGRFGMSVDNFKAVKDPNTGSYSVSLQK